MGWGLQAINNVMTPGLRCLLSCIDFIQRAWLFVLIWGFLYLQSLGSGRLVPGTRGCMYDVLPKPFGALLSSSGVFAQVPV